MEKAVENSVSHHPCERKERNGEKECWDLREASPWKTCSSSRFLPEAYSSFLPQCSRGTCFQGQPKPRWSLPKSLVSQRSRPWPILSSCSCRSMMLLRSVRLSSSRRRCRDDVLFPPTLESFDFIINATVNVSKVIGGKSWMDAAMTL